MSKSSRQPLRARGRSAAARAPAKGRGRAATGARRSAGAARSSWRRQPARSRRHWPRLLRWGLVAVIWAAIAGLALLAYFAYDLPDISRVTVAERRPELRILAADETLLMRYGDSTGQAVGLEDMPDHLIQAVLAIEDRRFYSHMGIDPWGLVRAMTHNLREGRLAQGGSTITQQLAKNLFLSHERTLRRKVQEALLAVWLEATYTKDEILAAYLNRVYLGAGAYGVDAAARTYFGIGVEDVSVQQAALLAGLLKAPSRFSPTSNPELAEARAAVVLEAMVDAGFLDALPDAPAAAGPVPVPPRRPGVGSQARYFADWVADRLPDFVGYDPVDLTIATTLDPELQRLAQGAVARHAGGLGPGGQVALVALATDGAVVAMVGGRAYETSQFNRATQAVRQPGSAFKPLVYLAAIERGLSGDTPVLDGPIEIGGWTPANFSGRYRGTIPAEEALAHSANTAAVRVMREVGPDRVIALARRLGIRADWPAELSLALGTGGVSLLELTQAYATFANGGNGVFAYGIRAVVGADGRALFERSGGGPGRLADGDDVAVLNGMLAAVLDRGTGRVAALDRPAAGKTGTSQDHRDAWFVGFTADLVVGVWVGRDDNAPLDGITGGTVPARIWRDFMVPAHRGRPAAPLPLPAETVAPPLVEPQGVEPLVVEPLPLQPLPVAPLAAETETPAPAEDPMTRLVREVLADG